MGLRPYQELAVQAIESEWGAGRSRTLLVQATGTGKTVVMAEMARRECESGGRTLLLAHRGELLQQAADKIGAFAGLACGVEKAQERAGFLEPVVVGSVQSMCRQSRLERYSPDDFSLVMVDEAHHAVAETYKRVVDFFGESRLLGVTATPDRKGLGDIFDSVAFEYGLADGVKDGYLVPIEALTIPLSLDLSGARKRSGDFAAEDVASALDPYLESVADEMIAAGCLGRKTVAFLPLVATSERFRDILESRGFRAAEVNGESPDRAQILADFDEGRYDVLCNAMLLTEGWDCPSVDCVVPLRATQSRPLYAQMVGRGTRPSPETGKTSLLLLDFLWQTEKHSLVRPAHLLCSDEDVADRMTERIAESGLACDLMETERAAKSDVVAEREEALARKLQELRNRKRKFVDPLQFAISIEAADLVDYKAEFAWQRKPPTEKQLAALERAGIDVSEVLDAGMASLLMDHLMARRQQNLATPKMVRQLESRGFRRVGLWTFEQAHKMIGAIAENGWKVPHWCCPDTYNPNEQQYAGDDAWLVGA